MPNRPRIVILGAGPAGLGAAFQIGRRGLAQVTLLERNNEVGGNAGSFDIANLRVDYGSHRLHPSCDARVMEDIRFLLGDDLLHRRRHGRIRLRDQWIHFPLKPMDLALRLPINFAAGVAGDALRKHFLRGVNTSGEQENFASVLKAGLGNTICQDFYFPFARKIWGVEPEALSATQAYRRVSANSFLKIINKMFPFLPGSRQMNGKYFFYPRHGFGQIAEALYRESQNAGALIQLNATVKKVESTKEKLLLTYEHNEKLHQVEADQVWSTIPITTLAQCLKPSPPQMYLDAICQINYRAMILIYLVIEQNRFTEFDAHYFPGLDIPITRLSEPKNYNGCEEPRGRTVVCAELPCDPNDAIWSQSNEELKDLILRSLDTVGLPIQVPVQQVIVRRIRQAYPIYQHGYEASFKLLDKWISQVKGLLTFGRQGLFAHDNTHHALHMAYCAVDCLDSDGNFDRNLWGKYRKTFETHVVED